MRKLTTPLTEEDVKSLHAGDHVLLSGVVYTARDAAHLRMMDLIRAGKPLPVDLAGQVIYYAGPTPTPPGRPVGSIGPTTSTRMDSSTPLTDSTFSSDICIDYPVSFSTGVNGDSPWFISNG